MALKLICRTLPAKYPALLSCQEAIAARAEDLKSTTRVHNEKMLRLEEDRKRYK